MTHQELATKWAAYNSLSGKATKKLLVNALKLDAETLARMLADRGIK